MFCLCNLLEGASHLIKAAVCALCLFVIGGPVLIAVGVVMLVAPNNRASQVATYNAAVANFGGRATMRSWSGTIGGQIALFQNPPVQVEGNMEDVSTAGQSAIMQSSVTFARNALQTPNVLSSVAFSVSPVVPFTRSVAPAKSQSVQIGCTSADCSSSCGKSPYTCSQSTLQSRCNSYGVGAAYSPNSLSTCSSSASSCGTCTYTLALQTMCVVVSNASNGWAEDAVLKSCRYPFDASSGMKYGSAPQMTNGTLLTSAISMYQSTDPLIVLEQVTKGTSNFGLTEKQQRLIGLVLAIIGAAMSLFVFGGGYLVYRCLTKSRQAQTGHEAVLQQPFLTPPPPPPPRPVAYAMNPVYGQPSPDPYGMYHMDGGAVMGTPMAQYDPYNSSGFGAPQLPPQPLGINPLLKTPH